VRISIVDEAGDEVEDGRAGEVVVRSPWQMLGYLADVEAPWQRDGGIRTGDIGLLRDGYLHLRGRSKEMIKSGGEQVFPLDVEQVVMGHPAVVAAAAYGVPDATWGERVECAVVLADPSGVSEEELQVHCRRFLAAFKVPKRFLFLAELPLTPNAKVNRRALTQAASDA
jgi:acyl-CoA synthetase (AMP-forming)/AMP-acid ligase II